MNFTSKKSIYIPLFSAKWGGGQFEFDILGVVGAFRALRSMTNVLRRAGSEGDTSEYRRDFSPTVKNHGGSLK